MGKRKRKHSKALRFGIGDPTVSAFAVWRLWVQGDEVYLAVRAHIQQMKASLHSSGKWSFRLANKQGFTIDRPPPLMSGVTRGPGVIYAGGLVQNALPGIPLDGDPQINWFDAPPHGKKISFTVLFTKKSLTQKDLERTLNPSPFLLGPLPLRNDERVWIASVEEDLLESELTVFTDIKNNISVKVKGDEDGMADAHAIMVQTTSQDEIVFLGIVLGKENLVLET